MKYFEWRQTSEGKFTPCPIWDNIGMARIKGSGLVLPARFFGLSWVEYLRFCRQMGATLIGKNHNFVRPCWDHEDSKFMDLLNERTAAIARIIDLRGLKY